MLGQERPVSQPDVTSPVVRHPSPSLEDLGSEKKTFLKIKAETVRGNTRLHFLHPELERRLSYMGAFLYKDFLRKRNKLCYFSLHEINLY